MEAEYDRYSNNLSQSFNGLSDEQINDQIRTQNIDLEEPLTNFETFHHFTSLRNELDEKERVWLLDPNPNFHETPQIHPIPTFSERCLWNTKGEVMVAGRIYKYTEDNTKFIKIEDGDFAKLLLINIGDPNIFNNSMVSFVVMDPQNNSTAVISSSSLQCTGQSLNSVVTDLDVVHKVVTSNRLRLKDWSFGKYSLSAGTVTYKKIGNFYNRYATQIQVVLQGQRYNNCGNSPTLVQGLSKLRINSAVSVELKRNYKITTKYDNSMSSITSYHSTGWNGAYNQFPFFNTTLRLKY